MKQINFPIPISAILLDLDGTLLHTSPELAEAANRMRFDLNLPALNHEILMNFIGNGLNRLVKRALTGNMHAEPDSLLLTKAVPIFENHYSELLLQSKMFDGVYIGLMAMKNAGFRLGCITNKPKRFTAPLIKGLGLEAFFEIVLSGDSLPERKPHPMPLLHAAQFLKLPIEQVLLIGDSLSDALAARAAGCSIFCVPYGYNHGQPVDMLDSDAVIHDLSSALKLIKLI